MRIVSNAAWSLVVVVIAAAGCSSSGSHDSSRDLASPDLASTDLAKGVWTDTPYLATTATHSFAAAETATEPGVDYGARIVTSVGTIVVDLTEAETPITVNSFVFLARHHFFEGIAFHRVIEDFMAQSGDPNSISGAPSSWGYGDPGYSFDDEFVSSLNFAEGGVLAMANGGPNTNGSQFFITFSEASFLDGVHTVFGRVIEGQSVLANIARGEPPASPTRIVSVQIIQR